MSGLFDGQRSAFASGVAGLVALCALAAVPALSQTATPKPGSAILPGAVAPLPAAGNGTLKVSAVFGKDQPEIASGLDWRVFQERAEQDGKHQLVAESREAAPAFTLPSGNYVVHVAYGLAGAVRRVAIEEGGANRERIILNAGALRMHGTLADREIPGNRLSVTVYVPDGNNPEGKIVAKELKGEQVLRLPEGTYHVVSTYLEGGAPGLSGAGNLPATNSVVSADVRIQAGKLTVATIKHRAAQLTLKLVNAPGGEALANTSFTILTPGGDVLRELIGAFPSLILAEGEYVGIARNDGRTFQSMFKVESGVDRDVEILTTSGAPPATPPR